MLKIDSQIYIVGAFVWKVEWSSQYRQIGIGSVLVLISLAFGKGAHLFLSWQHALRLEKSYPHYVN